jgi:hypothetical protein
VEHGEEQQHMANNRTGHSTKKYVQPLDADELQRAISSAGTTQSSTGMPQPTACHPHSSSNNSRKPKSHSRCSAPASTLNPKANLTTIAVAASQSTAAAAAAVAVAAATLTAASSKPAESAQPSASPHSIAVRCQDVGRLDVPVPHSVAVQVLHS